jgi:hypothetical protein
MTGALWAKEWFEFLINTGTAGLVSGYDTMDDEDRAGLAQAIAELQDGYALSAAGGEIGLVAAGRMMSGAFLIGAYATVTTSHKNLLRSKPASDVAKLPRSPERAADKAAIEEVFKNKGNISADEVARIIGKKKSTQNF